MIITDDEVVSLYNYSMKYIVRIARKLSYNENQFDDVCTIGKIVLMEMINSCSSDNLSKDLIEKYIKENIEIEMKKRIRECCNDEQSKFERNCRSLDSRKMTNKINNGFI